MQQGKFPINKKTPSLIRDEVIPRFHSIMQLIYILHT